MKRLLILGQFALLAVIGCSGKVAPVADSPAADMPSTTTTVQTTEADGSVTSVTFVSLKVPNMV